MSQVMTKIEQLEQEIKKLSPGEFVSFRDWFTKYDAEVWDAQIENDVHSGRMAKIADKALTDYHEGKTRAL